MVTLPSRWTPHALVTGDVRREWVCPTPTPTGEGVNVGGVLGLVVFTLIVVPIFCASLLFILGLAARIEEDWAEKFCDYLYCMGRGRH